MFVKVCYLYYQVVSAVIVYVLINVKSDQQLIGNEDKLLLLP